MQLPSGNGALIGNVWGDAFTAGVLPEMRDRLYADHMRGAIRALVDDTRTFCGVGEACEGTPQRLPKTGTGAGAKWASRGVYVA